MKPPAAKPLFLARQNYRGRRVRDMARMLPLLGLFLFLLPMMRGGAGLGGQLVFVFGTWAGLIVLAALLARRLCHEGNCGPDDRDRAEAEE